MRRSNTMAPSVDWDPTRYNRMTNHPDNREEQIARTLEARRGETTSTWWLLLSVVPLLLAAVLSFGSLMSVHDLCWSWEGVAWLRRLNFLLIAPLWAAGALLAFKGKARFVIVVLAFIFPATVLTMFQSAVAGARIAREPMDHTYGTMLATRNQIQDYIKAHRQPPAGLAAVAEAGSQPPQVVDGWGHPLEYSVDRDGVITLTSLGADGQPGGDGLDADVVMQYRSRNPDGTLNVDDGSWTTSRR